MADLEPGFERPWDSFEIAQRGIAGYRTLLSQGCRNAEHLHERVQRADDLEAVQEPNLFIYSFRYVPEDIQQRADGSAGSTVVDEYADWLNQRIADDLRFTGLAYVTTTTVRDNVETDVEDLAAVADATVFPTDEENGRVGTDTVRTRSS